MQFLRCLSGDIIEQYPLVLDVLMVAASLIFVPEAWLAQRLLGLFGFGPLGPVKGKTGYLAP